MKTGETQHAHSPRVRGKALGGPAAAAIPFVVAALIATHLLLFTWRINPPLLDGDDAVYLLMADFFSPFSERDGAITGLVMRRSYFPPLYPLLLGLMGAVSASAVLAHAVTVAFLFAAIVAFYLWSQKMVESRSTALVFAWLVTVLPATVFQMFSLVSEGLYLFLTLVPLLLAARELESSQWRYLAAVAVGLAIVSRTVGFALWLAYTIWLVSGRRAGWKTLPWVALLPWLAWSVWRWFHGYAASYSGNVMELLANQTVWGLIGNQLAVAPKHIWLGWATSLNHLGTSAGMVAGAVIGGLCLAGLAKRLWLRSLDGIYVTIYLAVLLLWPYPYESRRLLFVVLPILLVHGWMFAVWIASHLVSGPAVAKSAGISYLGLIGIAAFPAIYSIHERLALGMQDANRRYAVAASWYMYPRVADARARIAEETALVGAWRELGSKLDRQDCVYHLKPVAFMLYADRRAYATPHASNETEFWARATLCRHFYLGAFVYPTYPGSFYPRQYLGPNVRVLSVDYLEEGQRNRPLGMLVYVDRRPGA